MNANQHPRVAITVCIVTYMREAVLVRSLSKLGASDFQDFEVLIVDNGLSATLPNLIERVRLTQPVRLVQATENKGCANLNLLLPIAKGEIIACFDDDSYPARECLGRAWHLFKHRPSLGMIGFKMHVPETGEPWHDPWWNPDSKIPRPTVLCPGCGLAFRNDPRLPKDICIPEITTQAHELSMAAEIARLGYEIEFQPHCIAYHPDTTIGYVGKKAEIGNLNQLRFLCLYGNRKILALLILTNLMAKFRGAPSHIAFIFSCLFLQSRRIHDNDTIRRFYQVVIWNTHPRLHFLIDRPRPTLAHHRA